MINETKVALFLRKLKLEGDCLVFTGCRKNGYGQFNNQYEKQAHRFSWLMHNGPIPEKLMVLHKCDNPPCVRISHLFLGTQTDNMQDMKRKGRTYIAPGEKSSCAKITEDIANEIILLLEQGIFVKDISKKLSIGSNIINHIRKRRTWKHLPRSSKLLENGITRGSRNNLSKLTELQVQEIRKLISQKMRINDIAKLFNVQEKTIYNIKNKECWAHLPE